MLDKLIRGLPEGASVLDYGCFGWDLYARCQNIRSDLKHFAADTQKPDDIPQGVQFCAVDYETSKTDFTDDSFDLVVASHVIEHSKDPITMFAELARICKGSGLIYLEAPSECSCRVLSDPDYKSHTFFSFWDDPTHVRPWTPAAFYRLGESFDLETQETHYIGGFRDKFVWPFIWGASKLSGNKDALTPALWRAKKWACAVAYRKPTEMRGRPDYHYVSFKPRPGL